MLGSIAAAELPVRDGRIALCGGGAKAHEQRAMPIFDGTHDAQRASLTAHHRNRAMPPKDVPKDPEQMVMATAYAMAMANGGVGTSRVVKLFIDDARKVLVEVLKVAKRRKWEVAELLLALDPPKPKPKPKPWEKYASPPRSGGP
jgi:hypothetical protein